MNGPKYEIRDGVTWVSPTSGRWYVLGEGPWCGTVSGYVNHLCRCHKCKAAGHARYLRERTERLDRERYVADVTASMRTSARRRVLARRRQKEGES